MHRIVGFLIVSVALLLPLSSDEWTKERVVKEFGRLQSKGAADSKAIMRIVSEINSEKYEFLNQEEKKRLKKDIEEAKKELLKPTWYILYFTSSTVPARDYRDLLLKVAVLQKNGVIIETKQFLLGPPGKFKEYLMSIQKELDKMKKRSSYTSLAKQNFHLKFGPDFFSAYEIKNVPAMAFAACVGIPSAQSCDVKFFIRGEVPLETFFDEMWKFSKIEEFKRCRDYIVSNKAEW